jgi:glycosyltransferase involved in cell wall biosynthesis
MPAQESEKEKRNILVLLWHAPHAVIAAGGFRRTYELFDRAPDNVRICALDDNPSLLQGLDRNNVQVIEYRIPRLVRRLEERFFWFERALEWKLSTVLMVAICARLRAAGERFDVVFVPSSEQVPALLAGIAAKWLFGVKLVACSTNLDIYHGAVKRLLARLHNRADTVIVISEHLKKQFEAYRVRARLVINGVGLDTKAIECIAEPAAREYDAVFVGRHDREKGVFDLIEIWRAVVGERPNATLLMIGSCNPHNRAKLASMVSDYGLDKNVSIMGTVAEDEKFSLMKRSRVCLFPSYVEEWGLVPQEALACGLPVVTYDLPAHR